MDKRLLIVEDEPLIAMDLEMSMEDKGWDIVGPVGTAEQAMVLIKSETIDVAILDFNLKTDTTEQVALELVGRGTGVIFLSGDSLSDRQEMLAKCPVMAKPVNMDDLHQQLLDQL